MPINGTNPNIPYPYELVNVKTLTCSYKLIKGKSSSVVKVWLVPINCPTTLSPKYVIELANDSMKLYLNECLVCANKLGMKLFQIV